MTLRCLISLVMLALPAFCQIDASTLRAKYGPPLNRETFKVKQGVELIVDYGPSLQVCRMELPGSMPNAQSDQILGELVPAAMRGKETGRMAMTSGINSIVTVEYENVTIAETHNGNGRQTLFVTFKNNGCPVPGQP